MHYLTKAVRTRLFFSLIFLAWLNLSYADPKEEQIDLMVNNIVEAMTKEELIGQKIIIGPPWIHPDTTDYKKTAAYKQLRSLISKYKIGNFMLADVNYKDWFAHELGKSKVIGKYKRANSDTIRHQTQFLRDIIFHNLESKVPPLIAMDFEGGVVQHFRDLDGDGKLLETPSPMNYAATRDPKLVKEFGQIVGALLRDLGITTNFAPLIDVTQEEQLSIIGTRAYSSDEELVQVMASNFSKGLAEAGIASVLKHWPGLGTIQDVKSTKDWNPNVDIHKLGMPLSLRSSVDQFKDIYHTVLYRKSIEPSPAVMTAHVLASEYAKICGTDQNVVTFCRNIIHDQLREKGVKVKEKVIISDDFAYLRATRSWGRLSGALKAALDAGHDMLIIGALHPNAYKGLFCGEKNQRLGCKNNTVEIALEELYNNYEFDEIELRASVKRILKWKFATYSSLSKEMTSATWLKNTYAPRKSNVASHLQKLNNHSEQVFEKSLLIVGPSELKPDTFHEKIKIGTKTKILCVAPTYSRNDLYEALKGHFPNTKCLDLKYFDGALQKEEQFVTESAASIINMLEESEFEVFIFGLVNKPAHLAVWNKVYDSISNEDFKNRHKDSRCILVAFNSPAVLSSLKVGDDVSILTTFSNSRNANHVLVDSLRNRVTPHGSEYLPVAVKPYRNRVVLDPSGSISEAKAEDDEQWWLVAYWYTLVMSIVSFFIITFIINRDWKLGLATASLGTIAFIKIGQNNIPQFMEQFNLTVMSITIEGAVLWNLFGPLLLAFIVLALLELSIKYFGRGKKQIKNNTA